MNLASEVPRFDPGWGQIFFFLSTQYNQSMSFEVESHALSSLPTNQYFASDYMNVPALSEISSMATNEAKNRYPMYALAYIMKGQEDIAELLHAVKCTLLNKNLFHVLARLEFHH